MPITLLAPRRACSILWRSVGALIALAAAVAPTAAKAQGEQVRGARTAGAQAPDGQGQSPFADTASLVVSGRVVATFRAPLGALSPRDRVTEAARRIEMLVETGANDAVAARMVREGMLVSVGAHPVFTITPADIDSVQGESFASLGARIPARLGAAMRAVRESRSLPHILTGAALAVLATLLFFGAIRLLLFARRVTITRLRGTETPRLHLPAVRGFALVSPDTLSLVARRGVEVLAWVAGLFLGYLWLAFVLTRFAYTRPWGEALGTYLTATVGRLALTALGGIPGLFTVVLIFVATRWFVRIVEAFFGAVETGTVDVPWVHPETANPTRRIVVALLWLFAIVVAYPYMPGSGSDVFKGVSVFAGLVLSIGSSGIVNQAMSGLVLMYSRALKPGDYVRIGETEGVVTTLGMLSTKIRTTKNEDVTLPNAVVVGASIKNFSRAEQVEGLLLYTTLTIGYDTPWRQVEGLLLMAARRTPGLRAEPAPFVLKPALSDFYVEYQLNAVLETPGQRVRVLDRLHAEVLDAFNEFGVQITSPHYEADPANAKVVPRAEWRRPPAVD